MRNDLRFALRTLRRSPGFTLLAVLSLALGIGANTAIFSLLYQVVLRALPVRDPSTLVSLTTDEYNYGHTRRDNNESVFSYPLYQALRDHHEVFTGLVARSAFPATLAYHGDAQRVSAEVVTGNFFDVLGVKPALGRLLIPSDDSPQQSPTIVLGHSYWVNHLGSDLNILNSRVLMNGHPALVAGVAPQGFRSLLPGNDPDFYAPVSMMPLISPGWEANTQPDFHWLNLMGRLRPDVSRERANAMLLPLYRGILRDELAQIKDIDQTARRKLLAKTLLTKPAAQGLNSLRQQWQSPLVVLAVMVGLVLLIACANVANLLIARATVRQREVAIRLAVGATRAKLARQLMSESVVLAFAGGLLGLFLSETLTQGLLGLLPADATGGWLAPQLDARLLVYSMALAVVTGLLFGLAPAIQAVRYGVAPVLKQQTGGMSASGSQSLLRQGLIVAQICLSLLLLIGACLFARSLMNLVHSDPGFRTDRLVTFAIDPGLGGYNLEHRLNLFRSLQERIGSLPGVTAVARAWTIPLGGWNWGNGLKVPGSRNAGQEFVNCGENSVSPNYFTVMGIPLLAGRAFNNNDNARSGKVVIVSQTFAAFCLRMTIPSAGTCKWVRATRTRKWSAWSATPGRATCVRKRNACSTSRMSKGTPPSPACRLSSCAPAATSAA